MGTSSRRGRDRPIGPWIARLVAFGLCALHGGAIWIAMGGWSGLTSPWPILLDDHGIHFHQGWATRWVLASSGTTAGYDPSFMAGYPMSILSDLSSTLPALTMVLLGATRPAFAYKLYVLACAALVPWLVAAAGVVWRVRPSALVATVALDLLYFWTDFPNGYAAMGMLSYLLAIPLGLLTTAAVTDYLRRGGARRWLTAATGSALVFLVHLSSPMIVAPAGAAAYLVALATARRSGARIPLSRHLGLWGILPMVLLINAFWWWPAARVWSTRGVGFGAFVHPEPVLGRLGEVAWSAPAIEVVLLGLGLVGLATLARRDIIAVAGLGGFIVAGLGWGYLAGASRWLDSFEPGRHTYALYTGAALAAGIGLGEILARLRSEIGGRLDRWAIVALLLFGIRLFGMPLSYRVRQYGGSESPLSSRPPARLVWLVDRLHHHLRPGDRILYEETGKRLPGVPDPFDGRHGSGVLPYLTGVEVIGGPYLHATVTTNFTQFGEDRLFRATDWGRDHFVRYARLYRPSALVCWSPRARSFCRSNPDLIRVIEDDGTVLIGRVLGFTGAAIRGTADIRAAPGRLTVRTGSAGPDGRVVLRYHLIPHLRSRPPVRLEPIFLERDPVPFISLPPNSGPLTLEMDLLP